MRRRLDARGVNRRRGRRLRLSAIVDIVSALRKMSTEPDQVHGAILTEQLLCLENLLPHANSTEAECRRHHRS